MGEKITPQSEKLPDRNCGKVRKAFEQMEKQPDVEARSKLSTKKKKDREVNRGEENIP